MAFPHQLSHDYIIRHFIVVLFSSKMPLMQCIHCKGFNQAQHTTHQEIHLHNCQVYKQWVKDNDLEDRTIAGSNIWRIESMNAHISRWVLSSELKKWADNLFAQAIYYRDLSLSIFDNNFFFTEAFSLFFYTSLKWDTLSCTLLNKVYIASKQVMITDVFICNVYLNFSVNISTNISQQCIQNLNVLFSDDTSFHWQSQNFREVKKSAENTVKWLTACMLKVVTFIDWVNSLITDTCFTMKVTWRGLKKEFSFFFYVLCNSHDLQLIVKNLFMLSDITELMKSAQWLITAFKNASLQLFYLWDAQHQAISKERTLVRAVMTHWESQINALLLRYSY